MKSKKKNSKSYILIHKQFDQTQALWLQNESILSYFIYSSLNRSKVGCIYKGEVTQVLPSLGACFVDIGESQDVFLQQKEILKDLNDDKTISIQKRIQKNQKILVQITKDSLGFKAAQASMVIRLVGSKLIYMPQIEEGVNLSKKIIEEKERERLKKIISRLKVKGRVIVRTKAVGQKNFRKEINHLYEVWDQVQKNKRKSKGLVWEEAPEEIQFLRNYLQPETQVLIDEKSVYQKANSFVKRFLPEFKAQIFHYKKRDLFKKFEIDKKLKQAHKTKVYLKSGGALHIEETEALVSIDVNTAKSTQKKSQEWTNLSTNLEAVQEITSQMRIRNLGGIIVIDLVNMEETSSQEKVLNLLKEELKKDSAPTEFISFSSLQLVQIVRKRTQKSLKKLTHQKCSVCGGSGSIKKPKVVALEIFREILKKNAVSQPSELIIKCHPTVLEWIQEQDDVYSDPILRKYKKKLSFKPQEKSSPEYFEIDKSYKNMRKSLS